MKVLRLTSRTALMTLEKRLQQCVESWSTQWCHSSPTPRVTCRAVMTFETQAHSRASTVRESSSDGAAWLIVTSEERSTILLGSLAARCAQDEVLAHLWTQAS